MAQLDVSNLEVSVSEHLNRFIPLVNRFQLPTKPPFAVEHWTILLAESMDPEDRFLINLQRIQTASPFDQIELQLLYSGTWGQIKDTPEQLPLVEAMTLWIPKLATERQVKERISTALGSRLGTFRQRIRPLIHSMSRPSFNVRLILTFGIRQENEHGDILSSFGVDLPRNRRRESIIKEITARLLPVLRDFRSFTPAQGRPPDTMDGSRWWAMFVFDGLTVGQIADRESGNGPDAADLEERIEIAIRRLGLRTK